MRGRIAVVATALTGLLFTSAVAAAPAGASPVARDNTAAICTTTSKTVTDGLKSFVDDMKVVSSKATSGDLAGAQAQVKVGGAKLTEIGTQLKTEGAQAENPQLKTAVSDLSGEFQSLGGSLTDLTSLQNFSTTKLQQFADQMGKICGVPAASLAPSPVTTD